MRGALFLLLSLSAISATAAGDPSVIQPGMILKTLGPFESCRAEQTKPCPAASGAHFLGIPPGVKLTVTAVAGSDVAFDYQDRGGRRFSLKVNRHVLERYTAVDTDWPRILAELNEERWLGRPPLSDVDYCFETIADPKRLACPRDLALWTYAKARAFLTHCTPPALDLVKRDDSLPQSEKCHAPTRADYSSSSQWKSCPTPPPCPADVERRLRKRAEATRLHQVWACNPFRTGNAPPKPPSTLAPDERCLIQRRSDPTRLVIHSTETSPDSHAGVIQNLHLGRDYADVGYHFVIARTPSGGWRVFEGRKLDAEGANVGPGLNSDSIGIAIAGFYDPQERNALNPSAPDLQPTPEAMAQLQALIEDLKKKYPSLQGAVSHGEARHAGTGCPTTCPGPGCAGMIHTLKSRHFPGGDK